MSAKIQELDYGSRYLYYAYCEQCGWTSNDYLDFDFAENKAVTHDGDNHPEVF